MSLRNMDGSLITSQYNKMNSVINNSEPEHFYSYCGKDCGFLQCVFNS